MPFQYRVVPIDAFLDYIEAMTNFENLDGYLVDDQETNNITELLADGFELKFIVKGKGLFEKEIVG